MSRQSTLARCAMANGVAQQFLEWVGEQDETHTVGKIIHHFNIEDPAHGRYKSTVAVVVTDAGSDQGGR